MTLHAGGTGACLTCLAVVFPQCESYDTLPMAGGLSRGVWTGFFWGGGLSEDVVMAIGGGVPDRGGAWVACCASVISMYCWINMPLYKGLGIGCFFLV